MTADLQGLLRHTMIDFNQMKSFVRDPLILTDGDGIYVKDVQGRTYIDGISGVFVVGLGHSETSIVRAMVAQLERLTFASPVMAISDRALELVGRVIEVSKGRAELVKLLNGGSEATEAAIRMARQYHRRQGQGQRYKVISLYRSYHGSTAGALSATGWAGLKSPYEPLATGFVHGFPPTCFSCPLGHTYPESRMACVHLIRQLIENEGPETVAAIIMEPILLSAGVHVPPAEFHPMIRCLCDEYGILLIYDEIITAFGRAGQWFAADHVGAWPDLLCTGKAMSSGYAPLSAVLATGRVASAFWGEPEEEVHFRAGHSYGANPVSAAAGLETINQMMQRNMLDSVRAQGDYLLQKLESLGDHHEVIADVRGVGLLCGVEFRADSPGQEPMAPRIQRACRDRGLLVRGYASPDVLAFGPPYITTPGELDKMVDISSEAIAEVASRR